ncbi:MAG: hypothetical protein P4L33_22545 [Capsulimonadaceae bacterium]|nr:hypothetical protein [Capsulimonadaceae bacterium]
MKLFTVVAPLAAAFAALACAPVCAQTCPFAPGPGQNNVPVIFWAHYMPQAPLSVMHVETDVVPLVTQDGNAEKQAQRTMEAALDSGINGFQMLGCAPDEYFEAAKQIKAQSGRVFYIAPEWCDQDADPVKNANLIADFAVKHADDPCIARVNGAQVHFFYGGVKWAAGDGLAKARQVFKDRGVKVLLNPTISCFDRLALERNDLAQHKPWPALEAPHVGNGDWLKSLGWDGATDFGVNLRTDVALALNERLKERADSFTFYPDIWPGYDCSNREFYAIHCRIQGLTSLRDGLRLWTGLGYKQMSFITWNDMNETMLMPSSRNVYGYAEMIRYCHQLAENGQSPFDAPKFVVAYQPEALLGDQAFFQCDILPEHNTVSSDYVVSFRLDDQNGRTVTTLSSRATTGSENDDPFLELRMDTTPLAGKTEVLVPYVTVRQFGHESGEMRTLYSNLRLAPIRLRYNNVRFLRPMVIALDRVAPDETVALSVKPAAGRTASVSASANGPEPLKRLILAESQLSAGSFRADDTLAGVPAGQIRQFVRIDIGAKTRCRLAVDGGVIDERYTPYWTMDACRTVGPAASMDYDSQQNWGASWNVFRITGCPNTKIVLTLDVKGTPQTIATSLADVLAGNVRRTIQVGGKPVEVSLIATTGTNEANIDYPLPASGAYQRTVPLSPYAEQVRVYHAYALTASGKVAYSLPVVLDSASKAPAKNGVVAPGERIPAPVVETQGAFDDFVDDSAEESRNPYGTSDLRSVDLPVGDIPYYRLALDEGEGVAINDAAVGHQYGYGRIEGPFEWLPSGWRGGCVKLSPPALIRIRSTSWPYGAVTVSARVRTPGGTSGGGASILSIGPFKATFEAGKVTVAQRFTMLSASGAVALSPGWNHVAFVYDLSRLRVYVNGKLAASSETGTPVLQRTHWGPEIRIAQVAGQRALLDGGIDQIEVIGCALDGASVSALYAKGQWKGD